MPRTAHRVPILVFCEAEGINERDAQIVAEMALRRALKQAPSRFK